MSTVTKTRAVKLAPMTRTMSGVRTMIGVTWTAMSHGHTARSIVRDSDMTTPRSTPIAAASAKPVRLVTSEIRVATPIRDHVAALIPSNNRCGGGTMSAAPLEEAKLFGSEYASAYHAPTITALTTPGATSPRSRERTPDPVDAVTG